MRAFRFRVWDREKKKMLGGNDIEGFEYIDEISGVVVYPVEILPVPTRCVVMGATGLEDKNGDMIYEGDRLRVDEVKVEIVYSNGSFWCVEKDEEGKVIVDLFTPFRLNKEIVGEIVGNIYEEKK